MGKRLALEIFLVSLVGLALGLIGPYSTFEWPLAFRIAYWLVFGLAGYAIFRPLLIVGTWLSEALGISRFIGVGLALIVASLPMTLLVAALIWKLDIVSALSWPDLPQLYVQVWLIGFLTSSFFMLLFRKPTDTKPIELAPTDSAAPANSIGPSFEDRLPPGFGPLLALKGEDHYVRAIGETRDVLLLIRLRDAIAELGGGADGMQVHRSWWVARDAVASVRRDGRAMTLLLKNGTEVPVSRDNVGHINAAKWGVGRTPEA